MHTDNRSNDDILADIVRTCSLNLTKEEVDIYEQMIGKQVIFPESIQQDTYRIPKTLLDQAIKDINLTKNQAETLKQDFSNLPDFVDLHDHPQNNTEPLEPELTNLTVQDDLTQLNNHIDTLLVIKPTLYQSELHPLLTFSFHRFVFCLVNRVWPGEALGP